MNDDIPRYVYVIGVTGMQAVKIGAAFDCELRMANLQIGCPLLMDLFWKKPSDNARAMEKALHEHFADRRIRGEWFDLGLDPVPQVEQFFTQQAPGLPPVKVMSPNQRLIHEIGVLLDTFFKDKEFIIGYDLVDELLRIDHHLFDRSQTRMAQMVVEAVDIPLKLARIGDEKVKGYFREDLRAFVEKIEGMK